MTTKTTAEEAVKIGGYRNNEVIELIKAIRPSWKASYLDHPEIIVGLAEGRFSASGLFNRIEQMAAADSEE